MSGCVSDSVSEILCRHRHTLDYIIKRIQVTGLESRSLSFRTVSGDRVSARVTK